MLMSTVECLVQQRFAFKVTCFAQILVSNEIVALLTYACIWHLYNWSAWHSVWLGRCC